MALVNTTKILVAPTSVTPISVLQLGGLTARGGWLAYTLLAAAWSWRTVCKILV